MTAPDVGGLRGALADLPGRIRTVCDQEIVLPNVAATTSVLVAAAGDDAIDAGVVVEQALVHSTVPVVVHSTNTLPTWVGPACTVIVVALTRVDARSRSLADQALARGASVVVICADQDFGAESSLRGAHVILLDASVVAPRVLPGVVAVALTKVLGALGLEVDASGFIEQIHTSVESVTAQCGAQSSGRERPESASFARRVGRTMPLIYGSGVTGEAAARWWKSAVNQSAKLPAFAASIGAMSHDEIAGFGQAGDVTRQIFTLVLLDDPAHKSDFVAVDEVLAEVVAGVERPDVPVCPVPWIAQAVFGQWVGVELAALADVDPSATSILDEFWADR